MTLQNRPVRGDGRPGSHVPYYLALEVAAEAWAAAMATTCHGLLEPWDLGVVHVRSDFRFELFVGETDFDVELRRIGSSSIAFGVTITQEGRSTATVTAVLARVDDLRTHSVPFSPEQRAALEKLLAG